MRCVLEEVERERKVDGVKCCGVDGGVRGGGICQRWGGGEDELR